MHDNGPPLAVIGGGSMAQAILAPRETPLPYASICVADRNAHCRDRFETAVSSAREAMQWLRDHESEPGAGQIMLAVKPQMLTDVAGEIAEDVGERVVLSILAGARTSTIRDVLGGACRVVRVMPNTPSQIGRGMSAISLGEGTSELDAEPAARLFENVGRVIRIDESMMDAFTAVAGSGPAYVFYLAEAMIKGALKVGFNEKDAALIVQETIAGAAELLRTDGASASDLRTRVTSKKGTTQAATDTFDQLNVMESIARGVVAARDRGIELGRD